MTITSTETPQNKWGLKEWVLIATLGLNICGIVWGAAVMYTTVERLNTAVDTLNRTSTTILTDLAAIKIEYHARISVLEDYKRRMEQAR